MVSDPTHAFPRPVADATPAEPAAGEAADVVFDRLRSGFDDAVARRPDELATSFHRFAGRTVRIRVVGSPRSHRIPDPFSHLVDHATDRAEPDLSIDLWEEPRSGLTTPGGQAVGPSSESVSQRPARLAVTPDGRWVSRQEALVETTLDRQQGHLVGRIADADRLTLHQASSPLQHELSLWYRDHGIQTIHAGLVQTRVGGALLVGPSGAGKTTVVLCCVRSGLAMVGDDYVGLDEGTNGHFTGHSLYGSVLLEPKHLRRFPELRQHVLPVAGRLVTETKTFVPLGCAFPRELEPAAPIRVVLLPRWMHAGAVGLRPASGDEALRGLMPTSLRLLPRRELESGLQRLGRLVRRVPARWLDMGADPARITEHVSEAIEEAAAGAT